jgi:hypothetical protein
MDIAIYIKGQRLDLFQDESIEMNLNAKIFQIYRKSLLTLRKVLQFSKS